MMGHSSTSRARRKGVAEGTNQKDKNKQSSSAPKPKAETAAAAGPKKGDDEGKTLYVRLKRGTTEARLEQMKGVKVLRFYPGEDDDPLDMPEARILVEQNALDLLPKKDAKLFVMKESVEELIHIVL